MTPEELGIYRGEVITIMGALADISVKLDKIIAYIEGEDDEETEEDDEYEDGGGS